MNTRLAEPIVYRFFKIILICSRTKQTSTDFRISDKGKKKVWMHDASIMLLIYENGLPDLGEGHVGVDVLEPGFVTAFHVCELGEEQLLLGII
jgi:hypothetical protein